MKFTAVLRVYPNSKYDGTCTRADLDGLLDSEGLPLDETHELWESDLVGEADDLFLWTDNPSVYGVPDEVHRVLGHKLTYDDFQTGEYGKYEGGGTNYDVQFLKLDFEAVETPDGWELVLPPPVLVFSQVEQNEDGTSARVKFGYFEGEGTPTAEQVLDRTPYPTVLSERAKLKRYVLEFLT